MNKVTKSILFLFIATTSLFAQGWESDTTEWVEISGEDSMILELRYATANNFVDHVIYDCARCFLRPNVAQKLKAVNRSLLIKGYRLKLFDCYRPLEVQWELWEEVPDPRYVADPHEGSMHNRGMAIDLTIVDSKGVELDMGTDFDHFGQMAYHSYTPQLSEDIQNNRKLLKESMESVGFEIEEVIADGEWVCIVAKK